MEGKPAVILDSSIIIFYNANIFLPPTGQIPNKKN